MAYQWDERKGKNHPPPTVFASGSVRRVLQLERGEGIESVPTFFGLSAAQVMGDVLWYAARNELTFAPRQGRRSSAPCQPQVFRSPSLKGIGLPGMALGRVWDEIQDPDVAGGVDMKAMATAPTSPTAHTVQIIWADRDIKVTRQPNADVSEPDLYVVWKRMSPIVYKKY